MMSKKISDEDIEKAIVKLKPIFRIEPKIYLTIIYSFILLMVLFFLLIYPGIKNNGTIIYIETFPIEAAVYIDDIYKGSTPFKIFVADGEREIRIEKKYFETISTINSIKGRVFGTLFFPKKIKIINNLTLINDKKFLEDRFSQISSYALIKNYYDSYQMPSLISRTVYEYLAGSKADNRDLLYDFLYSIRVNLGSPEMVSDYVKAISLINNTVSNNLKSTKKDGVEQNLSIIFNYFADENNSKGLMLSIIKAYPIDKRKNIIESLRKIEGINSILNNLDNTYIDTEVLNEPAITGETVVINNSKFIGFSSGTFLTGSTSTVDTELLIKDDILVTFPNIATVTEFYILEKEVTRGEYSLFLEENPVWKIENIDNLIENNKVTKDYLNLQDFNETEAPISNISWYAASAYCAWLETRLPSNMMSNYSIKLPSELEWEAAAKFNTTAISRGIFYESGVSAAKATNFTREGSAGLYDMRGNLWEWCKNWYFPTDSVNGSFGLIDNRWDGIEKAVRGGSWANSEIAIEVSTRGSQNPTWCTPFLGFRPVMVKNNEQ